MTERRLLFVQPSGWVPPIFELVDGRKKKVRDGYRDAALEEEKKEQWYYAFTRAGWSAEHYAQREEVTAALQRHTYEIVIVPGFYWKDEAFMKALRARDPKPIVLVAINDWDDAPGLLAYTGADNWFPYWYKNNVASAAAIWLRGGPTPEEQAVEDGTLPRKPPPPPKKKRAAKKPAAPKE